MEKMTEKQREIVQFYKDYIKSFKTQPSLQFVADKFEISRQAVHKHLMLCVEKGIISKEHLKGSHGGYYKF
jgi:predicted DNA-binding protein YlxM (UPF0122 family)